MQLRVPVVESSQIGEARRVAARIALDARLDEQSTGRLAIVASELATNLCRHATDGEILVQRLDTPAGPLVEVMAIDRGPGMADPERCLRDGYSTNGTSGNGLGAVQRLSRTFEIYSTPGRGTVVVSRIGAAGSPAGDWPFGVVQLPYPGEIVCGDGWSLSERTDGLSMLLVDGLGHGPHAKEAASAAIEAFQKSASAMPDAILERAHSSMTSTRGGAVAVLRCTGSGTMQYVSVGNIAGTLIAGGKSRGLSAQNGTVGAQMRRLRTDDYACPPGSLVVLHSDGLLSRWNLESYPGLAARHPSLVAAVLYRDFRRGRDDVTVMAVRLPAR